MSYYGDYDIRTCPRCKQNTEVSHMQYTGTMSVCYTCWCALSQDLLDKLGLTDEDFRLLKRLIKNE